jgi:hypothetical protein
MRLGEEVWEIQEALKVVKKLHKFEIATEWWARVKDYPCEGVLTMY